MSTVRAIDLRYLRRWAQARRRPALRQMGVDEIYLGKKHRFLTVVTNLESGELSAFQQGAIHVARVDMWEPFMWNYTYEGATLRYLQSWIDQLGWQRLKPMEKLARMLMDHLEGILNYCRTKVPMGVMEGVNGNIKAWLRRGRGYRDLNYLLLKTQRLAASKTEFIVLQKTA